MEGEQFYIHLTDDAKPNCVSRPRTIPFTYCEKPKEKLELLQEQNINAPVTKATEWCALIIVTYKKKTQTAFKCALIILI